MYLGIIVKRFLELHKIVSCLDTLADFLNSAAPTSGDYLNKTGDYDKNLQKVLLKYPVMSDFTNFYSPQLSYSQTDKEIYKNSYRLYNELSMCRNYLLKELKEAFNPLIAMKATFSFPITLIRFLGINPNITFANFINLIAWLLAFILNLYSNEIKMLITQFLKLL